MPSTEKHGSVHSGSDDPDAKIWNKRVDGIATARSKLSKRNYTTNSVVGPVKRKVTEETVSESTQPHHDLMNALNTFKYSHVIFSPKDEKGKHRVILHPKAKNGRTAAEPFSRDLSDDHYNSFKKWFDSSQPNARKRQPTPLPTNEEVEPINELSKDTLRRYLEKAYNTPEGKTAFVKGASKKAIRRGDGMERAHDKLRHNSVDEETVSEANDSYKKHKDGSSTWEPRDGQPYAEHGIKIMYKNRPYMHNGRSIPDVTSYAVHKGKIIPDSVSSHPTFTHNAVSKYLYGPNGIAKGKQK